MGYTDITVHGFRSTFRDWCAEQTNFPREVAESALAHSLKDKTEAAYQRGDYLEKRRELMGSWANYLTEPKGKVILTDPIEPAELKCLYEQALGFVHVSNYEGFNLPLVEAMSGGVPMVLSDIEVHREVSGGNAVFVNPTKVNDIGDGMHRLINDSALRKQLKEGGLERAKAFDWKKTAEETLYVYDLFATV